ncbi:MAG: hypothetical protein V4631_17210 [Pseudomonadota bacterium]
MKSQHFHTLCLVSGLIALGALSGCDRRTAEEKGAALATEKIDIAKGIGDAMEKKGGQAGEAVTTGIGTVVKGLEKGVGKTTGRSIAADDTVTKAGLKITKVQDAPAGEEGKKRTQGLDLYVVADADATGKLRVLMLDNLDNEIGRATVDLVRSADEAKYQRVPVDELVMMTAISKLVISYKPAAALAQK